MYAGSTSLIEQDSQRNKEIGSCFLLASKVVRIFLSDHKHIICARRRTSPSIRGHIIHTTRSAGISSYTRQRPLDMTSYLLLPGIHQSVQLPRCSSILVISSRSGSRRAVACDRRSKRFRHALIVALRCVLCCYCDPQTVGGLLMRMMTHREKRELRSVCGQNRYWGILSRVYASFPPGAECPHQSVERLTQQVSGVEREEEGGRGGKASRVFEKERKGSGRGASEGTGS